jgi:hypothetical protein
MGSMTMKWIDSGVKMSEEAQPYRVCCQDAKWLYPGSVFRRRVIFS